MSERPTDPINGPYRREVVCIERVDLMVLLRSIRGMERALGKFLRETTAASTGDSDSPAQRQTS